MQVLFIYYIHISYLYSVDELFAPGDAVICLVEVIREYVRVTEQRRVERTSCEI